MLYEVITPGWIDTGAYQHEDDYVQRYSSPDEAQHPAGRVGKPQDIANMVLYLCSEDAGFMDGQNIVVDGGMTRRMIYHGDNGWTMNEKESDATYRILRTHIFTGDHPSKHRFGCCVITSYSIHYTKLYD